MLMKIFSRFLSKPINNQEELETCIEHAFQKLINATYPINRYKRGFYKDCLISDETMKHLQSLLTDFIFREGFLTNSNNLYKFLIHYNVFDPNSLSNIHAIISDIQDNFLYYRLQSLDTELRYLYSVDIQHLKMLLYSIYIRESVNSHIVETIVNLIETNFESDMSKFYTLPSKLQKTIITKYVKYVIEFFENIIINEHMYLILLMSTILNKNQILIQLNPEALQKLQHNTKQNLDFPFDKNNNSGNDNNSGPILQ